jgi:hypothetical protein
VYKIASYATKGAEEEGDGERNGTKREWRKIWWYELQTIVNTEHVLICEVA